MRIQIIIVPLYCQVNQLAPQPMATFKAFFVNDIISWNISKLSTCMLDSGQIAKYLVLAAIMDVHGQDACISIKAYLTTLEEGEGLPLDNIEISGIHNEAMNYHEDNPNFVYDQAVLIDHVCNVIMGMYFDPMYLKDSFGIKINETYGHVFDADKGGDFTFEVK